MTRGPASRAPSRRRPSRAVPAAGAPAQPPSPNLPRAAVAAAARPCRARRAYGAAAAPVYGQAIAPYPGGPGSIGQVRGTGICILLFIVTLGIYGWVWWYKVHDEMKRHTGQGIGGGISLLLAFLVSRRDALHHLERGRWRSTPGADSTHPSRE